MWRNPSHPDRPLHAIVQPPGPALFAAIRDALAGEGPAVLPLAPGQEGPAIEALRPTHVGGSPRDGGAGVPGDVAVVISTSGSTGPPKGVMLSAAALRASATASARPGASAGCAACPSPTSPACRSWYARCSRTANR
jgi:O-succinylbenzoic acid--CoA ligase